MSDADISAPVARVIGRPFRRGVSPNPGGRSKVVRDIQELARAHGPAAIATLAQALRSRNERVRVAAAAILLDRAYGKPVQAIAADPATSPIALHLIAAQLISAQLLEQRPQTHAQEQPQLQRLLDAPVPTE